jgi:hypothetical protein
MPKKIEAVEEKEICEYGVVFDQSRQYIASRSFFLQTRNGPLTGIQPGNLVRLSDRTGHELFLAGKVVPIEVGAIFEVIQNFRTVDASGDWLNVQRGDIIKLNSDEAFSLWREGKIQEKKGKHDENKSTT